MLFVVRWFSDNKHGADIYPEAEEDPLQRLVASTFGFLATPWSSGVFSFLHVIVAFSQVVHRVATRIPPLGTLPGRKHA